MMTLWTQLFSSRTRSARKAARPTRLRRLDIEKLDDRVQRITHNLLRRALA